MEFSISEFKNRCMEIVRRVEKTRESVVVTRRGRVVARLEAAARPHKLPGAKPWERLRGRAQ